MIYSCMLFLPLMHEIVLFDDGINFHELIFYIFFKIPFFKFRFTFLTYQEVKLIFYIHLLVSFLNK